MRTVFDRGASVSEFLGRGRRGRLRRERLASSVVVLVIASLATVIPLPVAASAAAAASKCPVSRPDEASAMVTARMCGGKVLVDADESSSTEVYALPDGSLQATTAMAPQRVQQADGSWAPVDLTMRVQADGSVAPAMSAFPVSLSGSAGIGTHQLAALGSGSTRVVLDWTGVLPQPVLAGNTATYVDVRAGVDLVVSANASGIEQDIVVKNRAALARIAGLSVPMVTDAADSFTAAAGGAVTFKDGKGRAFAVVPGMRMWDATTNPATGQPDARPLAATVTKIAAKAGKGGANLALAPDAAWLNDPTRVFPITLDPAITASTTFDTYVKQGSSTDYSGDNDLQFGVTGGQVTRSFLSWDMSQMEHAKINSATVFFYDFYSPSCTAAQWDLWFDATGATAATTYANQPAGTTLEASSTATKGFSSACDDGWISASGTAFFQAAANTGSSRGYMQLRAHDESSTSIGFKQVRSRNAADPSQVPYATVNYTSTPVVGTRSTSPATPCGTGSGRPYISSKIPQLKSIVTQGDAATSTVNIEWWAVGGSAKIGSAAITGVASGNTATASVPAGAFAEAGNYMWRVDAVSGTATSAWSPWCEFTVDTIAPTSPPTVSSTDYPAGAWSGAIGIQGTFTFGANGVADVNSYLYGLDTPTPTSSVMASVGSANVTPVANGPHTLYVQSVDRAGNKSTVTSYSFFVGGAAVTSPTIGSTTAGTTILQGAAPSGTTGVTFQWRRAVTDGWTAIPVGDVTYSTGGGAVTAWPIATTGTVTPKLNWNVKSTLGGAAALAGPVLVEAVFTGGSGGTSPAVNFSYDPNLATGATSTVGPGSVNLVSGDFSVSGSDVSVSSYGSDLTTTRTFNTRQAGTFDTTHMFGPGWLSTALVADADAPYTSLTVSGSLVQVGLPDGTTIGFTAKSGSAFTPEVGAEDLTLTFAASTYTLADQDGNKVAFTQITGAPAGQYTPTAVTQPGSGQTTTMTWQTTTVDGVTVTRPTQLLAPKPADVTSCSPMAKGCRALIYAYATTTSATGTAQAGWGDYAGRVQKISFTAWDPTSATIKTVAVAAYSYDSNGRLVAEWDPRVDNGTAHLWTTYSYNADGTLATITPNTQPVWNLAYTTIPGDSGAGRLKSASRTDPVAGTATTTVVYNAPLTTALGGPYDMDSATTSQWDENDGPTLAAAVFDDGPIPDGNQTTGAMPTSWTHATVTYMDANSRAVNTVTPGGYISTSWYDRFGNVVQSLTANDRVEALDPSTLAWFNTTSPLLADDLSTIHTYNSDGTFETSTAGPYHELTMSDSTWAIGRDVTTNTPDEGAPTGTCPCGLITTQVDSVTYWDGGVPGAGTLIQGADSKTTTTSYDWTLRQPLVVTVDPIGLALTTTTTYDPVTGLVNSTTTPAGGSTTNTPATTLTVYYSTLANSTYPECGLHPEWADLVCMTAPAGQAASGPELPMTETTYDMFNQPLVVTESTSAGVLRTTTTTYDPAERPLTTAIVGAAGTGTPIPTQQNVYDPATGNLTHVQSLTTGTPQTTSVYDTLGRVTSYTDTDGVQSTTSYDKLGRPTTVSDGQQSTTTSYNTTSENRGLPTQIVDGQAGTITGSYDADGNLVQENWPNGIVVTREYNEIDALDSITYTKPGCGLSDCTLDAEQAYFGRGGKLVGYDETFQSAWYFYDAAGRLSNTPTWNAADQCTTRVYGFGDSTSGRASDRTSLTTYGPQTNGDCQTGTPATTKAWTYDTADRLTTAGYTYDSLGRTTTVPAADTQQPAGGDLSVTYNVNDLVHTMQQGTGPASTYTLDIDNQRIRSWTDSTGIAHTNHYSDNADSPSWTNEGDGTSTRTITGLNDMDAIATSGGTVAWQISNIHGDVIATINNNDPGIDTVSEADEYGNMDNSSQVGADRYGWLGTKQRAADNPDGIILMGVRLYNPATSRFMSVDPLSGGSCNRYDYVCQNPTDSTDLNGRGGTGNPCLRYLKHGAYANIKTPAYLKCMHKDYPGWGHSSGPGLTFCGLMNGPGGWGAGGALNAAGRFAPKAIPIAGWALWGISGVCYAHQHHWFGWGRRWGRSWYDY